NKAYESDVLHDHGIHPTVRGRAQEQQRIAQFPRLEQDVQRQVDSPATLVRHATGLAYLIQRKLRALITSVVAECAEVNGVRAVRDGCANSVQGASGAEKLGHGR